MNWSTLRLSVWVGVVALANWVSSGSAAASDLGELKARGVLRVVVSSDEAQETFSLRPGTEPGFERELIEGFTKLHGLRVEPVPAHRGRVASLGTGPGCQTVSRPRGGRYRGLGGHRGLVRCASRTIS